MAEYRLVKIVDGVKVRLAHRTDGESLYPVNELVALIRGRTDGPFHVEVFVGDLGPEGGWYRCMMPPEMDIETGLPPDERWATKDEVEDRLKT